MHVIERGSAAASLKDIAAVPASKLPTHHFNSAFILQLKDTSVPQWDLQGSQVDQEPRRGISKECG